MDLSIYVYALPYMQLFDNLKSQNTQALHCRGIKINRHRACKE